jgi:hypothetical protein
VSKNKSGFHDPIAVKTEEPRNKPVKGLNSPWDFTAPSYDERTSCFVNAGTHYGVGYRQPVGHDGDPATSAACLPMGRVNTLDILPKRTGEKI